LIEVSSYRKQILIQNRFKMPRKLDEKRVVVAGFITPIWSKKVMIKAKLKKCLFMACCCIGQRPAKSGAAERGFTLAEILIVIVIMAVAAMMAVPMLSSAGRIQAQAAADMIASDLEYAKSLAISKGQTFFVVFDKDTDRYWIENDSGIVIAHPVKKGFDYIVDFSNDSRLDKVDLAGVYFDGTNAVGFDYLGMPLDGNGGDLGSGIITLDADDRASKVRIEAVTGYISISN